MLTLTHIDKSRVGNGYKWKSDNTLITLMTSYNGTRFYLRTKNVDILPKVKSYLIRICPKFTYVSRNYYSIRSKYEVRMNKHEIKDIVEKISKLSI